MDDKTKQITLSSLVPLFFVIYGFYLYQLKISMLDIAGSIMFILGILGLICALIINYFLRKHSWVNKWYLNILIGFVSCILMFLILIIYVRIN